MEFLFADYTQKTEALVTGIRLQNEAFDIYELQLLGLDKNNSCSYTNSGTATISDTELQELLHTNWLPFPNGIVGQRIKILSNLEMQKEQVQADILQKLSSSGEELNIDGWKERMRCFIWHITTRMQDDLGWRLHAWSDAKTHMESSFGCGTSLKCIVLGCTSYYLVEINAESAGQSAGCTTRECCHIWIEEKRKVQRIRTTAK